MILASLLALALSPQGEPHVVDLDYTISLPAPPDPTAIVLLRVRGARERIVLNAVERYAFTALEEPPLAGPVEVVDGANAPVEVVRDGPFQWTIQSGGADEVTAGWRVPLTHRQLEPVRANHDEYEFPYVAADHALLSAGALLFAPTSAALGEVRVRFELPEGWGVVAPWPAVEPGVYAPPSRRNLADDLIAVGAWRSHIVVAEDAGGRTEIAVAVAPGQEAVEERTLAIVDAIVRAELELFGTRPFERYLFVFGRPDTPGFGGSPKASSMTLSLQLGLPPERLESAIAHLVAHEFHHTWSASNGVPFPGRMRFFNEGFTDYYAYLVSARLGLMTWEGFGEVLRAKLVAVRSNAAWEQGSLAEAGGPDFFGGGETYELVYAGGLLCAAWLDLELRERERSELEDLDELMRAFVNGDARRAADSLPTLAELATLVERALGAEGRARFERFATRPRPELVDELDLLQQRLEVDPAELSALLESR